MVMAEIPQSEGLRFDVEGAAAGDNLVVAVVDEVIPHPAQEHGLRKGMGTVRIAGADLTQQGDQSVPPVPHQAIHLVQ